MKKQYEEQPEKKRLKKKSIIAIVLIIFMIGVIAGISKIADSRTVGVQSTDTEKDESIVYKGETYVPKKNISTYLIAGIDSSDRLRSSKSMMEPDTAIHLLWLYRIGVQTLVRH